jgi:hypothetical protein
VTSLRERSGKKSGRQKGHKGDTHRDRTIDGEARSARGSSFETGFNADYLLEALRTFGDRCRQSHAVVSICSHDLGSPHVIACGGHETYVLIPMRV